jgi:cytochrome d ubiquinol oxidase subunit I
MAFGDFNAQVKGIDAFPADQIPPLWMTFVSFHNMVMLGMLFIGVMGLGLLLMWRGRLMTSRWYHWMFFVVSPLPLAANQLGWISAEVGRQPWTVYKLLRTSESVSVTVGAPEILFSIILFGTVYLALGALYVFILFREMNHGPDAAGEVS